MSEPTDKTVVQEYISAHKWTLASRNARKRAISEEIVEILARYARSGDVDAATYLNNLLKESSEA